MHLDEEQVQRLLHGELAAPALTSVREHLAGCAECRGRVTEAAREEDEVYALLRRVDHPAPQVDASAVRARARARGLAWGRWAAGILAVLGAGGVAYAAPGSPLPDWVKVVVEWAGGRPDEAPVPPALSISGIAVAPGLELLILFTSPQSDGHAEVVLTDGAEVVVRAPAGSATFTSDLNRLVIDNRNSSASFEIQIPRSAPRVEIRVDGDRIFLKEGTRVTGPYLLRLTHSRR